MMNAPPKSFFHFFGLARELRDYMYDEMETVTRTIHRPLRTKLRASVKQAPATHLCLISRQFKAEYEERVSRKIVLHVHANILDVNDHLDGRVPARALALQRLHFDVYSSCTFSHDDDDPRQVNAHASCQTLTEMVYHMERIRHITAQLAHCHTVTIRLYTKSRKCFDSLCRLEDQLKDATHVAGLDVHHLDFGNRAAEMRPYGYTTQPYARWTPRSGTLQLTGLGPSDGEAGVPWWA